MTPGLRLVRGLTAWRRPRLLVARLTTPVKIQPKMRERGTLESVPGPECRLCHDLMSHPMKGQVVLVSSNGGICRRAGPYARRCELMFEPRGRAQCIS